MKHTVRIVALLLSTVMLISTLASCKNDSLSSSTDDPNLSSESTENTSQPTDSITDNPTDTEETAPEEEENYIFETVYPPVSVSSLKFTLTDNKLTEYEKKIIEAKRLFDNEKTSEDKFRNALYEILSLRAEIETQCDIAYLQYHYDMSDSDAWDNYLYAYDLLDEAKDLFWEFYNESKNEENKLANVFIEVVQKVYKGNLVTPISSTDSYAYDMERLEGQYNSLKNSNASDEEIFAVYKKYLTAANGLAVASSTKNYYEYACRYIYYRNDTAAQREELRKYVKEHLIPLCRALREKSWDLDGSLSQSDLDLSNKYLYDKYDSFDENYLFDYFSSLTASSGEAMTDAFEKDRVLIGNKDDSYNSAMVYVVGNTPICYFHEDQTDLETMAHELGHYYAWFVGDSTYFSTDLRETQSTANSMLLYSYLSDTLDSPAFKSSELYSVYNWMYQIILSVIKDEFDEIIYTHSPSALTLEDFERIMSDLIYEYNVRDLSSNITNQLMTYWRRLGITYPMSNYCYATAMITAFQIYTKSKDDYTAATEIYRRIVEEPQNEGDFVSTIINAGLTTPYDKQTYIELKKLLEIN